MRGATEYLTLSSIEGTVVACQANYYQVKLSLEDAEPHYFLCTRRARLKKLGQQVVVGDRVLVEEIDWQDKRGAIATIQTRTNLLDRPPISNVDQILLVFALAEPALDPAQLSRFLVKAESTGIPVTLCLNKRDLLCQESIDHWQTRLSDWGYEPLLVSVREDKELPVALMETLKHRVSVVAGPSGVGKSSLLNRLVPDVDARTNAVSGKLGRGRHTTRHVELFDLPAGGLLADTPGFNQPDLTCPVETLMACFPEIRQRAGHCQFNDCLHRDEPGCSVRGEWERYDYYLSLLNEVLHHQQQLDDRPTAEVTEKVKMGSDGQVQHEPKLEAKKYRRTSRRRHHQDLQDMCYDVMGAKSIDDVDDAVLEEYGF
ncbi:small ribosomal subunit biogenesis GTPase RsgA [Leptolyngbyaceae cyanobacterium CCMR0082]|uniref:Small ribosomal subunit biogenesis GTPase RsgA n=1 Tax=Adonisia turfae CCMR0082 TaxID=2304604 RepID=A0A6M0S4I0_9CYAN|nr:small ribosomal subunit biogenesis GTPase RsgA [Adonisia turfae]MDV3350535.1 small ribosomal subunit biogenesis GTPase RsgA [Leptothoe sp. LEGE 181152]NEZ63387.1 small ribosomal subunit biogenesis GTPase RsgA [Adonisia turfae CCMR0082]